jgi:hypothetical protein
MLTLSCRRGRFNRGKYLGQFRIAGVKYLGSVKTAELKSFRRETCFYHGEMLAKIYR